MSGRSTKASGQRQFSVALESRSAAMAIWIVREVTSRGAGEPAYYATTYPDSEVMSLETFETRRSISAFMGRNLRPGIRAAIEAEEAKRVGSGCEQGGS